MILEMSKTYTIKLSNHELNLVTRALGGRLKPEEVEDAKKLGESISVSKAKQTEQMLDENKKLVANQQDCGRSKPMPDKITFKLEDIQAAMNASEGFCIACGEVASGCEPDARNYKCEVCGERKVYGAEELLFMGLVE